MPLFSYRAFDEKGNEITGQIEAESAADAREKLIEKGKFPFSISDASLASRKEKSSLFSRIFPRKKDITLLTRQLATLVSAGVPLARSIESIARQSPDESTKQLLYSILEEVRSGETLAEALSRYPELFPTYYVNIVSAGEESGTLGRSLEILADYLDEQESITDKITTALAYPILMLLIAVSVVIFIMTFILPKVTGIFENLGASLPFSTRLLLAISGLLNRYWWAAVILLGFGYYGYQKVSRTGSGRKLIDRLKLSIPLMGRLVHLVSISRFTSTTSTLLTAGLSMGKTLTIAAGTTGNEIIASEITRARDRVIEGESLSRALGDEEHFPPTVVQMIAVGEESGNLPYMLEKATKSLMREYETLLTRFLSLLEPVIILLMGGIVGFIVVSIMLPLLNISQIIR